MKRSLLMCLFKDFCSPYQHCVSRNFAYTFIQCGPLVHCCCWYKSYKYQQNTPAHHSHLPPHSRRKTSRKIKTFSPFLLISQQKSRLKPSVLVGLLAPPVSPQDLPLVPPGQEVQAIAAPACTSVLQLNSNKTNVQRSKWSLAVSHRARGKLWQYS